MSLRRLQLLALHPIQHPFLACLQALYQPQGGLLASERCIQAHIALAQQHGAHIRTSEAVHSWHVDGSTQRRGDVVVVTSQGHYRCRQLVMTAGAWLPQLVPPLQVCCWRFFPCCLQFFGVMHCPARQLQCSDAFSL